MVLEIPAAARQCTIWEDVIEIVVLIYILRKSHCILATSFYCGTTQAELEAVGKQLQAELARLITLPVQLSLTYFGRTATSATKVLVNSPQNL